MVKAMFVFLICGYLAMMVGAYADDYKQPKSAKTAKIEAHPNQDMVEGDWQITKGKIRSKFGKLSNDDLEVIKGNLEELEGRIQKAYGYSKERAKLEYRSFKDSLNKKRNKG